MVPLYDHIINRAEKDIQMIKNHLISVICGVDDNFPMLIWYCMFQQAELTLNFLRQSRLVLTISAYAHFYGLRDYNL